MFGNYDNLMVELEWEAEGDFTNFLRMEPRMFRELLLQRLTQRLTKQETRLRQPLDPGLKLAITLQYLATGNSYQSLSHSFRSMSDCAVFNASTFKVTLETGDIRSPDPQPLPHDDINIPYFFIRDNGFH